VNLGTLEPRIIWRWGNWLGRFSVQNLGPGDVLVLLGNNLESPAAVSEENFSKRVVPGEYWEVRNFRGDIAVVRTSEGTASIQAVDDDGVTVELPPGDPVDPPPDIDILSVVITPDGDTVDQVTDIATFSAVVTGTIDGVPAPVSQDVIWSVNGVDGGNAALGYVNASGQYTAPDDQDRNSSVTLRARSSENPLIYDEVAVATPKFDLFIVDDMTNWDVSETSWLGTSTEVGYAAGAMAEGIAVNSFTSGGTIGAPGHPMVCRLHGTDCVKNSFVNRQTCQSTKETGDRHIFRSFRESVWGTSGFTQANCMLIYAGGPPVSVNLMFDPVNVAPDVGTGPKIIRCSTSKNVEMQILPSYTPDSIDTWAPPGAVLPDLDPRFQSFRAMPVSWLWTGSGITNASRGDSTRWFTATHPNGTTPKGDGYVYVYGANRGYGAGFDGGGMGGGRYICPHVASGGTTARTRLKTVDFDSKYDSTVRFMWVIRRPVSVSSGLGHTDFLGSGRELFVWNDITVTLATSGGGFELRVGGTIVATSGAAIPGGAGDLVQFDVEVLYGNPAGSVLATASLINDDGDSGSGTVSAQYSGSLGVFLRTGLEEPLMFTPPASANAVAQGGFLNSYYNADGFVRLCRLAKFYPVGGKAAQPVVLWVTTSLAEVEVNGAASFTAKVAGTTNQDVNWSVLGGASNGTIDVNGNYTAPALIPSPATITVRGTTAADPLVYEDTVLTIIPAETWTLLATETYDYGGANGVAYTGGPLAGWTNNGDFGFAGRITTSGDTDRGVRFPTQSEVGGSGNSQFRNHSVIGASVAANNGITDELRVKWRVKFPTNGGFTRQDGGGYSVNGACMASFANKENTRNHVIGIRNATTLGIWMNSSAGAAAIPTFATAPNASGSMGTITGGTWHTLEVIMKLNVANGYIELWFDGVKICEVVGNTLFNAGSGSSFGGTHYICHPCGATASNNDLTYFGACDTIELYK
jgi:hypothetical protein